MARFRDLSTELWELIALLLKPQQIVQFRALCSKFRRLVDSSPQLQYKIELYVSGMSDSSVSSPLSVKQRRALLKSTQAYFKQPGPIKFQKVNSFSLNAQETFSLGHSEHYVLRACAMADKHAANPSHCALMDLNLDDPVSSEICWNCPDLATAVENECFDVDVPLKLLAVRRPSNSSAPNTLQLSFLDLFTGEPHPRAATNPVIITHPDDVHLGSADDIQPGNLDIIGDALIISYNIQRRDLVALDTRVEGFPNILIIMVLDWVRGICIESFSFPSETLVTVCPISKDYFLLAWKDANVATLDLFSLTETSSPSPSASPLSVSIRARFYLPAFLPFDDFTADCCEIDLQVSQTPHLPSSSSFFVPSSESSIVCLSYNFWVPGLQSGDPPDEHARFHTINFISPTSTFLTRMSKLGAPAPTSFAWEDWGPLNTRWFHGDTPDNRNDACGYRVLSKSGKWIFDFNPVDIARDLTKAKLNKEKEEEDPDLSKSVSSIITGPSEIPGLGVFAQPLVGCLPYRESTVEGLEEDSVFWAINKVIHVQQDDDDENITVSLFAPQQ